MRIANRISLTLGAAGFLVFGLWGVLLLRTERRDLIDVLEASTRLIGRSLEVSVEAALAGGGPQVVAEVLEALAGIEPELGVLVGDVEGGVIARRPEPGGAGGEFDWLDATLDTALGAPGAGRIEYLPADDPTHLVLQLALSPKEAPRAALVLARPLEPLEQDLAATRRGIAVSMLLFALATALLGHLLGRLYIGRPLERLARAMGDVRSGDLRTSLPVASRDEVAAVAEEFNAMVSELAETRARLELETESKLRLEAGLQAADKLITIGQLSAGLAHEIGSPLQVLGGRARALANKAEDAQAVRRNAAILAEQVDRIAGIVDQLLRYARRVPAQRRPVRVAETLEAVVDLLGSEARRRGIRLEARFDPQTPVIEADPGQLQQIALNLLTNALFATGEGGRIVLSLRPVDPPPATPGAAAGHPSPAQRVAIEVTDDGVGIHPEDQARLFEPFFTTRAEQGGTGLGLSVVRAIALEHGGEVSFESELGLGTRIAVILPTTSGAPAASPQSPPSPQGSGPS